MAQEQKEGTHNTNEGYLIFLVKQLLSIELTVNLWESLPPKNG